MGIEGILGDCEKHEARCIACACSGSFGLRRKCRWGVQACAIQAVTTLAYQRPRTIDIQPIALRRMTYMFIMYSLVNILKPTVAGLDEHIIGRKSDTSDH
ncbi:hypothetical protein AG1IA_10172 [Rhizoctonia solani AG-1 IA]|uniref:Uncharacterized protein n=1 Tax=Thanatephorus cucumeris (strain AG1-IA) TaxID=983506 RepID=L8WGB8_THACA|nr:hypothetical protein AG1IA_10172 [Rhizoctonia solani AG-1 IA]